MGGGGHYEIKDRMENSVDPDAAAHYELSNLNLHCLQRYLVWSAGLKGLRSSFSPSLYSVQ